MIERGKDRLHETWRILIFLVEHFQKLFIVNIDLQLQNCLNFFVIIFYLKIETLQQQKRILKRFLRGDFLYFSTSTMNIWCNLKFGEFSRILAYQERTWQFLKNSTLQFFLSLYLTLYLKVYVFNTIYYMNYTYILKVKIKSLKIWRFWKHPFRTFCF